MKKFTFLIILVLTPFKNISGQLTIHEQQDDPNVWPGLCQNGNFQTPIDLIDFQIPCCNCSIIKYTGYDEIIGNVTLFNSGIVIEAEFESAAPSLTLDSNTFVLHQFHFHWGASEHALNSVLYDGEIHVMHRASDGTRLILGALLKKTATSGNLISDIFREAANSIVDYQSEIQHYVNGTWRELLDEINFDIFFNYLGSLTTPNCDEDVIWIVYPELIEVDSEAIEGLKNIEDSNGNKLLFTNRDLQPLDESREIFKCFNFQCL